MKANRFVWLLSFFLAGCGSGSDDSGADGAALSTAPEPKVVQEAAVHEFQLGQREYTIPAEYIPSIRVGGKNDFVRIKFPDFAAEIVLDEKSAGASDRTGRAQIFSITDRDYPRIAYSERANGEIVACRIGMVAQSGCGTIFEYAGVEWTLLFPIGRLDEVEGLVRKATHLLGQHSGEMRQERSSEDTPDQDAAQDQ